MKPASRAPRAAPGGATNHDAAAAGAASRRVGLLGLAIGVLLGGCAEAPVVPTPAVRTPGPAGAVIEPSSATAAAGSPLAERARRSAAQLEATGRWGEAAAQWEIVSLLRPADSEASRRAGQARGRARDEARARSAAAALARARGDLDTATRAYLLALAAEPDNAAAARALREIELERARRNQLARGNRTAGLEAAPRAATGRMPAAGNAPAGSGSPSAGNGRAAAAAQARAAAGDVALGDADGDVRALDEGITAFRQGEYERAINLLQAFLQRHPGDEEARAVLRDAQLELARKRERQAPK